MPKSIINLLRDQGEALLRSVMARNAERSRAASGRLRPCDELSLHFPLRAKIMDGFWVILLSLVIILCLRQILILLSRIFAFLGFEDWR